MLAQACVGALLVGGGLLAICLEEFLGVSAEVARHVEYGALAVALAGSIALNAPIAHRRRLARRHDYLLCRQCGYCLKGLAAEGTCPECGVEYRLDDVRRAWTSGLTLLGITPGPLGRKAGAGSRWIVRACYAWMGLTILLPLVWFAATFFIPERDLFVPWLITLVVVLAGYFVSFIVLERAP